MFYLPDTGEVIDCSNSVLSMLLSVLGGKTGAVPPVMDTLAQRPYKSITARTPRKQINNTMQVNNFPTALKLYSIF